MSAHSFSPQSFNRQSSLKQAITIVGAGATGVAIFIQTVHDLIKKSFASQVQINVIDKTAIARGGIAFDTPYDCNLLNVPAINMSIVEGDREHFFKWLLVNQHIIEKQYQLKVEENAYVPRKLYGMYLTDSFYAAKSLAESFGIEVFLFHDEVVDIDDSQGFLMVHLANTPALYSDQVVIAIGGFDSTFNAGITHTSGYFSSPYNERKPITQIPSQEDVFVIGTRLSAIDTILMLKSNGHQGKIICVSRTGQLPRVQGCYDKNKRTAIFTEKKLNQLSAHGKQPLELNALLKLIKREAEFQEQMKLSCNKLLRHYRNQKGLLQLEIERSENKVRLWQSAFINMNKMQNKIWALLSKTDQDLVFEKYVHPFSIYRPAMPLKTAVKLFKYMDEGSLLIRSSKDKILFDEQKQKYAITISKNKKFYAKYLINATGISFDVDRANNPLLNRLLKKGLISLNRFGGCNVNAETLNAINDKNQMNNSLYLVGAITIGTFFNVSLIEHLVDFSQGIAERFSSHIEKAMCAIDTAISA